MNKNLTFLVVAMLLALSIIITRSGAKNRQIAFFLK
jgi:hypothetical protein